MSGIQSRGDVKGDFFIIPGTFGAFPNGTTYVAVFDNSNGDSTEANRAITIDFPFLVRRIRTLVLANSATGDTVIAFRRSASTPTGCSVTYATTITGESATGIISVPFNSGQTMDWSVSVTDGAANTVTGNMFAICQRIRE